MNSQFRNLKNDNIKKYPNNTSVIIGKVNFKTNPNDLVGIYVGSELRGSTKIINYNNESWFNLSANCSGGNEKGSLVYYNSVKNQSIDCSELEFSVGKSLGSMSEPINLFEKKIKEIKTVTHKINYEDANLQISSISSNTDIKQINVKCDNKLLTELKLNNSVLDKTLQIPFENNLPKNITFEMMLKNNNLLGNKSVKIKPGQNIFTNLNLKKDFEHKMCLKCMEINTKNITTCPICKSSLKNINDNKLEITKNISSKIKSNIDRIKKNNSSLTELNKKYSQKLKHYEGLNRSYENRIRDIESLMKRGLLKKC